MFRVLSFCLVLAACLNATVQAAPPENPLKFFSSDVDIIIRLKEPDRTGEKVLGLVNKIQPGIGDTLKSNQSVLLGRMISNPTLTGVDQTRDWYVGVYFASGQAPVVVFAIPALNSDDLVSAVDGMTTQVEGKWVLYTDAEEMPQVTSATVADQLGEARTSYLLNGDLTVYVNTGHVTQVYAEQIDLAQDRVLQNLNQLRFMPSQGSFDPQQVIELYGKLAESLFQAVNDAQVSMASLSIAENELVFTKQVNFTDDSETSRFLAQNKPDAMSDLSRLPAGAQMYYGFSGEMKEMIRAGMKMSLAAVKDPSVTEKVEKSLALLEPVTYGPVVASLSVSPTSMSPFQAVAIASASPMKDVRDFNREVTKSMGLIENEIFKQTSTLKPDAETYGAHHADLLEIRQEIKPDAPAAELQQKIHKLMFGENGMQTRTVYLEKEYVTTTGGGEKLMQDFLAGFDSPKSKLLQKSRESLMKEANFLLLMDLPRFLGDVLSTASQNVEGFPIPINAQMINSLNLKPSYIGLATGSSSNTAQFELHLPVDQIVGISKLGVLIGTSVRGGL